MESLKSTHTGQHDGRRALMAIALVAGLGLAPGLGFAAGGGGGSFSRPTNTQTVKADPTPYYRAGVAAYNARDYARAAEQFGEVLKIVPKHGEANYYMGLTQVALEESKKAVRYLKKAAKYDKNNFEARARLGMAYLATGNEKKANRELETLNKTLDKCGDCGVGRKGRIEAAIEMLESALGGGEETVGSLLFRPVEAGEASYRAAVALINAERYEDAILDLRAAQAVVGPHPDILNYLGFAHRKLGRYDEAQLYYAQALKIQPDHLGANEYLGELYAELGDFDRARAQLAKLQELCSFGCAEEEDLRRAIATRLAGR